MLELATTASSLSTPAPCSSSRATGHQLPHRRRDRTPHLDFTANPRARLLLPHPDPPPRFYSQCQGLPSPPGTRLSTSSARQPPLVATSRSPAEKDNGPPAERQHGARDPWLHPASGPDRILPTDRRPGKLTERRLREAEGKRIPPRKHGRNTGPQRRRFAGAIGPPTTPQLGLTRAALRENEHRSIVTRSLATPNSDRYRSLIPRSSSETQRGRDHPRLRHSSLHRTKRSPRARASRSPHEKLRGTDPSKALHSRTSAETHRMRDHPPHHASTRSHASRSPGVRASLSRKENPRYADRHRTLAPRSTPETHRRHDRTHHRPASRRQASCSPKARTPLPYDTRPLHTDPNEPLDYRTPSRTGRGQERSIQQSPRRVPGSSLGPRKAVAITPPCATPQIRIIIRYGRKTNFTDSPIFTCNIPSLTT